MSGLSTDHGETIWQVGVFDAHCHPTDIMASIDEVSDMRARALTIMASRSQDQALVAKAASRYLLKEKTDLNDTKSRFIVPSFGWHPWFSHQLYDDRSGGDEKSAADHYRLVLSPSLDDAEFLRSLPAPRPLSEFLEQTERLLMEFPHALVGEVGLDRAFRIPVGPFKPPGQNPSEKSAHSNEDYTPGSREGRSLTPYRVVMDHQKVIMKAQLELAARFGRPVSIHSVQAHGVVFDVLQSLWAGHEKMSKRQQKRRRSVTDAHSEPREISGKLDAKSVVEDSQGSEATTTLPYPPRICLHSYSGPTDPLRQFLHPSVPADIFFSFSQCINFSTPSASKVIEVIKAVPNSQILVESDYHCAGPKMDEFLLQIVIKICEIKGWNIEAGSQRLRENWERFIFG